MMFALFSFAEQPRFDAAPANNFDKYPQDKTPAPHCKLASV
jgi:hypothetical protein